MSETAAKTGKNGARAATLGDVAQAAGVSKVAVSVVLNNSRSQVRVSPQTRERIEEAARALEYKPNAMARSLRRQRTDVIGFYSAQGQVFNPLYPFYGTILQGLLNGCEDHQKDLLLHGTFRHRSENDIFLELLNGQIDGLVLYARTATPLIQRLIDSRLPVITIADQVPGLPCVTVDDAMGGRLLANYLADQKYRSVLYRVTDRVLPSTVEQRWQSFRETATARGLTVELLHTTGARTEEFERELLLDKQRRPDVLAAFNDFSADFAVDFCRENNLSVPDDLAIVGFDGFAAEHRPSRRLTTIRAPWGEVARRAVSLLVAQHDGQEVPARTVLPVELVPGDTA